MEQPISQYICPGCSTTIDYSYVDKCDMYDKELAQKQLYNKFVSHKCNCQSFKKLDFIHQSYHDWAKNLSQNRYNIWLISKKFHNMVFFYSQEIHEGKYVFASYESPKEFSRRMMRIRNAHIIYENDDIMVLVMSITPISKGNYPQMVGNNTDSDTLEKLKVSLDDDIIQENY